MSAKPVLAGLLSSIVLAGPAHAQVHSAPGAMTRSDVEAWLDGFMPHALNRDDIAGAAVAVVTDGEVLLLKGYGYADLARQVPVDAKSTLFRLGSVGKLFTWTAVMQLVEAGRLDLDRDVNAYLDFSIPPRDGQPVTLRNLMTHTPGFEEVIKNLVTDKAETLLALDEFVKTWTPSRIFPAGQIPAYSNYGVALAGYIVQRVSGESFDDYIDRHVLDPLGMTSTTTRQPLPAHLTPRLSRGYVLGSGPAQDFEHFGPSPAGGASATAADIGRFMLAYLQDGQFGTARILKPDIVRQMFSTSLPIIPPLNSMLLGFFQQDVDGLRIVGHRGDTQYFHTTLNLFVDHGVGLFLAINSTGKDIASVSVPTALVNEFAERYFMATSSDRDVDRSTAAEHAKRMVGTYESSRRAQSTFPGLLNLLSQVRVSLDENGGVLIPALMDYSGAPMKWREIAPFVWLQVGGKERLAAKVENGRVTMFSVDSVSPFVVLQPVAWWRSSTVLFPLLAFSLAAILLTAMAWPAAALIRRHYGVSFTLTGPELGAYRLMRLATVAVVAVLAGWIGIVSLVSSSLFAFSSQLDPWILLLRTASLVVFTTAALIAGWNAWLAWTRNRGIFTRIWSVVLVVSCGAVLWVALAYKLVGISTDY